MPNCLTQSPYGLFATDTVLFVDSLLAEGDFESRVVLVQEGVPNRVLLVVKVTEYCLCHLCV